MFRFLLGLFFGILLTLLVPAVLLVAGVVDMSAAEGPGPVEEVVNDWAFERWVQVNAPEDLTNVAPPTTESWEQGLAVYQDTCVVCHGAGRVDPASWAQQMVPRPPDLAHSGDELTENELYVVIERGVRLSGMPAFGDVLDREQIWTLVRFVRDIEHLTPAQEEALRRRVEEVSPTPSAPSPVEPTPSEPTPSKEPESAAASDV